MPLFSITLRRLTALLAVASIVLLGAVSVATADAELSAARAESFNAARAKCAKNLGQSCYSQRLWQVRGGRCWVFRGVATGRVGRTHGCPGSPRYVY